MPRMHTSGGMPRTQTVGSGFVNRIFYASEVEKWI